MILSLVVVVLVAGLGGWYVGMKGWLGRNSVAVPIVPAANASPVASSLPSEDPQGKQPGGVACTMDAMQCPDGRWIGRSGPNCEFVCEGGGESPEDFFSVAIPNSFKKTYESNYVKFVFAGTNQERDADLNDGIILVFEKLVLTESLSEEVDAVIQEYRASDHAEIIKGKTPFSNDKLQGYEFVIRGVGVSTVYYVEDKLTGEPIIIRAVIQDPSDVGYSKQVQQILNSVSVM